MTAQRGDAIVILCRLIIFFSLAYWTNGMHVESCPSGWMKHEWVPPMCTVVSNNRKDLSAASTYCGSIGARLMQIDSEEKYEFLEDLTQLKKGDMWIPLFRDDQNLRWLTTNGSSPVITLPKAIREMSDSRLWPYEALSRGLVYRWRLFRMPRYVIAHFVCEKRAHCSKGWVGPACDEVCRCHANDCSPTDLVQTCKHGCQIGWMGKDCTIPKTDADVKYFCTNSLENGNYVHIRIDKKGVEYESIHAVNSSSGHWTPWCEGTKIHTNPHQNITKIEIHARGKSNGKCAGEITKDGHYQWRIQIQEKKGLVSRNDQEININCDFSNADNLKTHGDAEIQHESNFLPSDVKKQVKTLVETKETVELAIVDPLDGQKLSDYRIGSSVVLKISFGIGKEDVATGVFPHNCFASSPNSKKHVTFLDENGCPRDSSPIHAFSKNETKTLITEPFLLFGLEGTEAIEFHCSYILCFGDEQCPEGCAKSTDMMRFTGRYRRSINAKSLNKGHNQNVSG